MVDRRHKTNAGLAATVLLVALLVLSSVGAVILVGTAPVVAQSNETGGVGDGATTGAPPGGGPSGNATAEEYIDELLAVREQRRQEPVTEDELPEDAHLLENRSSSAVYLEYRTCGDESCSCMSDGEKHGPYKYRAYRDGETVRREYLGRATDMDE